MAARWFQARDRAEGMDLTAVAALLDQDGPLLFEVLEEPARNYALLATLIHAAALLTRTKGLRRLVALELVSVGLALVLLQGLYAVFDRERPSEHFDGAQIALATVSS